MKKTKIARILAVFFVLALAVPPPALASTACPSAGQIKREDGVLWVCNSGLVWTRVYTITTNGNVGFGTATPESPLHITNGYTQMEDNNAGAPPSTDCDEGGEEGRMTIDTSNSRIYVCAGDDGWWYAPTYPPPDGTPNAFSFTDVCTQSTNTLFQSDIVQISGISIPVSVSVSGSAAGLGFRTCSDAACSSVIHTWGTTSQTISNNQYLQLQGESHKMDTVVDVTVIVGGISDTWTLTVQSGMCMGGEGP